MGLKKYVLRRIGQLVVTYWAFLTLLFFMFRVLPGDPTSQFVMQGLSPEAREEMIRSLGLHRPLYLQYFDYLGQLVSFELGRSFTYKTPVMDVIVVRFWNTIFLMGFVLIIVYVLGTVVGTVLGWVRGSHLEKVGIFATITARSTPEFVTSIVLIMIFVFHLGWFPSGSMRSTGVEVTGFWNRYLAWDFVYHATLPALAGVIYYIATPILLMRNTMLDVLNSDFIEIKKAIGIAPHVVMYKHAARNSILPVVTSMAIATGLIIGGSVVIETVFDWPGMGREMVNAVQYNDYPLAQATFFLMGSVVIFMNFVADLLYVYLDPRIQYD